MNTRSLPESRSRRVAQRSAQRTHRRRRPSRSPTSRNTEQLDDWSFCLGSGEETDIFSASSISCTRAPLDHPIPWLFTEMQGGSVRKAQSRSHVCQQGRKYHGRGEGTDGTPQGRNEPWPRNVRIRRVRGGNGPVCGGTPAFGLLFRIFLSTNSHGIGLHRYDPAMA